MVGRGFGAILNVGSSAGMFAIPSSGTYSASKAYVNLLSEALYSELQGTGVSVTVLCPGPVPTEFQEIAGSAGHNPVPKAFYIDAVQCASEALEALKARRARHIPGTGMRAVMLSLETMPKAAVRPFLARLGRRARARG
jgi:short-subunit dehydrogenase